MYNKISKSKGKCVILTKGIVGLRKRITAVALSLVIAFGSLPVISVFAEPDETFSGFSGWSVSEKDKLAAVTGKSGYEAQITKHSGKASELLSDAVFVKSGKKYRAGVSVGSAAAKADAELLIAFFGDEKCENLIGEAVSLEKSNPTADLGELGGDFTVPEGANYARIIIRLGANGKAGDEYTVDNAYIYIYSAAAPIFENRDAAGYKDGEWARHYNDAVWENTETHGIETVEQGFESDGALHIFNTEPETDMWLTFTADSVPAGEYTVSMKVKGSVTAPDQAFRFTDRTHIDTAKNITAGSVSFEDWTDYSYTYTSDGSRDFYLIFSKYNGKTDFYIDCLKVVNNATGKDVLGGKGDFCVSGGYNLITSNNLIKNGDFEDIVYTYLSPDKFNGNFDGAAVNEEELKWSIFDNATNDTLELITDTAHGGALEMTKGASAAPGAGWVTLASPNISVEQGQKYRFGADLKGTGSNPYYIITAYWFFDNGKAPEQVKAGEGDLQSGWNTVTADFTAPQNAKEFQLRIVFQGAAGDKMQLDNASFCPLKGAPSLEGWQYAVGYSNPDLENCYVRLEDKGNADDGSVHFYREYENNTPNISAAVSYEFRVLENGKTYVAELWIKGKTQTAGDPLSAELGWGLGKWAKSGTAGLQFDIADYADWTKVSYEFTVTNTQWAPLIISAGGYAGVDCHIDNITVYEKSDAT